jgi:uncharacterized protein DUF222/HNH endonuclease
MVELEQPVALEIERLMEAVEEFCDCPPPVTGAERLARLIHSRRAIDRLELKFSQDSASFAATDEYEAQGSVSPIHCIRLSCNMGSGAVGDRLAVGEQLNQLPESGQAMVEGEIGFAHLALIARTATAIADAAGPVKPSFDETALLEKACEFSVGKFRDFCHHARHVADPEGYAEGEAQGVEARSLTLTAGQGGMVWLRGLLDPEGGATVRAALEPLARPSGKDDHRKRDRRLGDALVESAHRLLDGGQLPQRATQRPHLQVTTTLETLLGRAGVPAADVEFSPMPISAKAVERYACDCNVTRILLGADSAVIDVGRSKRVINPAQKRALNVRDKGCRWPGCDRPATWTSGHHLVHWTRGGPTDLPNLVLLCHRHHWMVHEGRWQLVKTAGGQLLTIPPPFGFSRQIAKGPD